MHRQNIRTFLETAVATLLVTANARAASILSGPVINPSNGHNYYLLTSDFWEPSEATATSLGGHLVTINDQLENDWVWDTFSLFGGTSRTLWTGYHRLVDNGPFVWVSGETPGFENWQAGEPNNFRGNENYAAFVPPGQDPTSKKWFDMFPETTYFFDNSPIHGVVEVVPEPSTVALCLSAIVAATYVVRRKLALAFSQFRE